MSYLIIMALLAAAAIARLWLQQRKVQSHQETVDGFQTALTKISEPNPIARGSRRAASSAGPVSVRSIPRQRQPLDPARREAAKRRLEARRRARASSSF